MFRLLAKIEDWCFSCGHHRVHSIVWPLYVRSAGKRKR